MCGGSWAHSEAVSNEHGSSSLPPSFLPLPPGVPGCSRYSAPHYLHYLRVSVLCVSGRLATDSGKWIWLVGTGCVTLGQMLLLGAGIKVLLQGSGSGCLRRINQAGTPQLPW